MLAGPFTGYGCSMTVFSNSDQSIAIIFLVVIIHVRLFDMQKHSVPVTTFETDFGHQGSIEKR